MIIVDIKLKSAISPKRSRSLGKVTITNDGTGTKHRGNYDVVVYDRAGRKYRHKRIEGWPRLRRSTWDLLREIFRKDNDRSELERTIVGALKDCRNAHGTKVTDAWISSAAKRVVGQLKALWKRTSHEASTAVRRRRATDRRRKAG